MSEPAADEPAARDAVPRDIPYRFERTHQTADIVGTWSALDPGEESGVTVGVAGRLMLLRNQGKAAFGELRDASGAVQLFARAALTERFEEFVKLNLGDWIGARGQVIRTRRGELSVLVSEWVLLAEARRNFGDKWPGVSDVETRYRQREVDLWANERSRQLLQMRSDVVRHMRRRLWEQGFVEVETPLLHPIAGGATARPFVTHHNTFDTEFTTLELYQAYADYNDTMVVFEELVAGLALDVLGTTKLTYGGRDLDLTTPWRRATMSELIAEATGFALNVRSPREELVKVATEIGIAVEAGWGPGKILLEIYEKTTETGLWGPVFVTDYPAEVSPLARRHRDGPDLVERYEPVVARRELGNGFTELIDPDDQRARFEEQAAKARAGDDEESAVVDEDYLRALEYGLPPTSGFGLGVDRLLMLLGDVGNIREVIAFPTLRPDRS